MKFFNDYSDYRLKTGCIYCNGTANTRDHIPSKVFLSKPYPTNLFVVPACEECNNSFSKDEAYVAFLVNYLKMLKHEDNTINNDTLES